MRRVVRAILVIAALVAVAGGASGLWVYSRLRASLPQLDESRPLKGLSAPVLITRDGLGVPTIRGASREDVARATGFLHAQDRFFQMDLARRRAAGELSALVGARGLAIDREIRVHRFRAEAQRAVAALGTEDRALLDAYTAGVNAGLSSLGAAPFEYLLLRAQPRPWLPEDSVLVVLSMFITLQDYQGAYESTLGTMNDVLPRQLYEFLAPVGTEWDSPIVGDAIPTPPIPGPDVYDLRARRSGRPVSPLGPRREDIRFPTSDSRAPGLVASALQLGRWSLGIPAAMGFESSDVGADRDGATGSNNWAVSGRLAADGGALLANDMHLLVRVPNTWYRAAFEWPDRSDLSHPHRLIGITLPGVPAMVVGSNTHIAWGFTNSQADWSDLVVLELDPQNHVRYKTPDGWRSFDRFDEAIEVAGSRTEHENVAWTIWGPVIGTDHAGRLRALRWVAHDTDRLGVASRALEDARTVDAAFTAVNGLGAPGQNFVVADEGGHIGWTVYGAIPRRVGLDGRLPSSWSDGSHGWSGWLARTDYPRIKDPADGRIWTANARVVDGDMLARLGDGNYEVGSRAHLIRERLMARERFTPRDLLDIQLETGAEFLNRWRDLILKTLTPSAVRNNANRARFRDLVEHTWNGRAAAASAGYRLTRLFREQASEMIIAFVLVECYEADGSFDYRTVRRREGPIWALVSQKPMHLLDPRFASWDALLMEAIDRVIERANADGGLAAPWSQANVTLYRHPLSSGLPFLGAWLDMPQRPLDGDLYTPRMHWGANAASERMIVSPGREADGIMHMPTGQSGHPLSPFYGNSHEAWIEGRPTPFLPGKTEHTLTLTP
ncbi:MAG TPA: penicillin acylase family protein [Vicinamibacterales bacterium]|jgi:penicillin amidase